MKKCLKCNLSFVTERKSCPLCSEILKDVEKDDVVFPLYPKPSEQAIKRSVFLRTLTFLTILLLTASLLINFFTYRQYPILWSLVVILAVGYFWILLRATFRGKSHIPMRLIIQMIVLSISTYIVDEVFGSKDWAINYVIPFISMASIVAVISLLFANRVKFGDYLLYMFACNIFGFIPFILWLLKVEGHTVLWPSLAAASLSFATIVAMIIFADKETKEEIKKRFHI